ncbi:hypothetical protein D9758_015699 [Tetrapyrgos nigripes]|uniref:NAD(P)-binding protein n=1 Tax=Tetrapyrgos nigripes TaxID=182062 RepID=A0A8H5C9M7_9AGAR|nr:hypothetical protein D9758_015699 [Tetrapyrgos nigripes]
MGSTLSLLRETFPPKPKWTTNDIPDLTGKVMIVTGANTGIGKDTVKALLEHNAKVYLGARSQAKAEAAIEDLRQKTGKEAIWLKLDLADLKSVKAAVEEFSSKESRLDVLFNNAGVMGPNFEDLTAQGYDLQWGTNVLGPSYFASWSINAISYRVLLSSIGHFYLTKLLLPILISTAEKNPDGKARVVNTSSSGHHGCQKLDFNTFRDSPARKKLGSFPGLYGQSKFGNILFANELARRYGDQGIVSTSLNPGNLSTDLARTMSKAFKIVIDLFLYPSELGALTQLKAGTSPEGAEMNGKYLVPWARVGKPSAATEDQKQSEELWKWLEEQVEGI